MSAQAWPLAKQVPWTAGRWDWGLLIQAQWRWWARRWAVAVTAFLLAWGAGVWLHAEIWLDLAQTRQEVQALQAKLAASPKGQPVTGALVSADLIRRLPTPDQHEQMWMHLQKALAKHRVRLISMQPVSEPLLAPLTNQAMLMRLQARFENWASLWAALVQMGPIWSMDRLRVVPSAGIDGVDIEVVWRVWAKTQDTENDPDEFAWEVAISSLQEAKSQLNGPSIFGSPTVKAKDPGADVRTPASVQTGAALGVLPEPVRTSDPLSQPQELIFSHEPERWPMGPLRVMGIWRDGEQAEAVLANATHWFRIREGRQLSLEGHRLWRVGGDGVQVRDPQGRVLTIRMEGKAP